MKKFFIMLTAIFLIASTKAETSSSALNPFKQNGVSVKVALETFTSAVTSASGGDMTAWNKLVRVPFDKYVELVRSNVSAYQPGVSTKEVRYMLANSKLVARRVHKGEKIGGVSPNGQPDYYIAMFDFDCAMLTYEYFDQQAGKNIQIDLAIWECFNPKEARKHFAETCQSRTDTLLIREPYPVDRERVVYRDVYQQQTQPQQVVYETIYQDRWYPTQIPFQPQGWFTVPLPLFFRMFGCQPTFRCNSGGVQCGMMPVNQTTNTIVNNYITNNSNVTVNNTIQVVHPDRPRPIGINTGGGGVQATNTGGGGVGAGNNGGGGDFPNNTGTNTTGGGGTGSQNTGGAGKNNWQQPYQQRPVIMNPGNPSQVNYDQNRSVGRTSTQTYSYNQQRPVQQAGNQVRPANNSYTPRQVTNTPVQQNVPRQYSNTSNAGSTRGFTPQQRPAQQQARPTQQMSQSRGLVGSRRY